MADFVDDWQEDSAQAFEFVGEPAAVVSCGEAGFNREAGGEVGFVGSGWAEEDHVLPGSDEVQRAQVRDLVAFDDGCVGEVEVLQGLAGGELRGFHAYLPAVRGVGGDFTF